MIAAAIDGWNGLNGSFAASPFVRLSTGSAGLGSGRSGPRPCGAQIVRVTVPPVKVRGRA